MMSRYDAHGIETEFEPGSRGRVRALIITPTRELAEQIHTHIGELGRQTRIRSLTVYGGVSMYSQSQKLRDGV